jgi:hypothetical protein
MAILDQGFREFNKPVFKASMPQEGQILKEIECLLYQLEGGALIDQAPIGHLTEENVRFSLNHILLRLNQTLQRLILLCLGLEEIHYQQAIHLFHLRIVI